MSLVEHLLVTRTPLEMAKMLKTEAEENAELRRRVLQLEIVAFWLKVDLELNPRRKQQPHETLVIYEW